ncbi:MAG: hypothetical protein WBX01_15750 [Nitrososphaeraceae archaeon]
MIYATELLYLLDPEYRMSFVIYSKVPLDHDKPVLSWLNFTSKSPKLADVGLWLKSHNLVGLNQFGVIIFVIIIPTLPIANPSPVFSQSDRMMTNFTTVFEDELTGEEACGLDYCSLYLDVEYQSPTLTGKLLRLAEGTTGYITNNLIWKGVDILKGEGYVIDSVQISGFGTDVNPYTYHVIMSNAVNFTAE